jgi:hypothetical protein
MAVAVSAPIICVHLRLDYVLRLYSRAFVSIRGSTRVHSWSPFLVDLGFG